MTPQLYNIEEAAAFLLVKPSWLRNQCRLRRVPFHLIARSYRFSERDLTQIAEASHRTPGRRATDLAPFRVAGRPALITPSGRPAHGRGGGA